jgi:hypothetical protein
MAQQFLDVFSSYWWSHTGATLDFQKKENTSVTLLWHLTFLPADLTVRLA